VTEIVKPTREMTIRELAAALNANGRRIRNNAEFILELAEELMRRGSLEYTSEVERERDEMVAALEAAWQREVSSSGSIAVMRRVHQRRTAELEAERDQWRAKAEEARTAFDEKSERSEEPC